jgi:hypothetical protein
MFDVGFEAANPEFKQAHRRTWMIRSEALKLHVDMSYMIQVLDWYGLENRCTVKQNSVAFSPQANYTDRATAVCRRS